MKLKDKETGSVYEIRDAHKNLKVRVTNKNVNEGIQCDACNCAIAMGVKEKPGLDYVRIGAGVAFVGNKNDDYLLRYTLKNTDRRMAKAFDVAKVFLPGTYTLQAPVGSKKIGARSGSKSGSQTRNGRARTVFNTPQVRGVFWPSPEGE